VGAASWGTLLLAALGALACVAPLLLVILAVAAFAPPRSSGLRCGNHRIAVLVPAHNEVELLPRCLASLRAQEYPAQLIRIVVVADNCTDATVEVARAAGAEVMVRDEPDLRGKGRALRWAIDRLVDETQPVDAIAVVDADSQAEPGLLGGLEAALTAGADAVQGEYLVLDDGSGPAIALRQAAFPSSTAPASGVEPPWDCPARWSATGCCWAGRCSSTCPGTPSPGRRTWSTPPICASPGSGRASPLGLWCEVQPRAWAVPPAPSGCAGRGDGSTWCAPACRGSWPRP